VSVVMVGSELGQRTMNGRLIVEGTTEIEKY
jgi:hypothetical protein